MRQEGPTETDHNTGRGWPSGSAPRGVSEPAKRCYYEVLAVSRDATQDDIKVAYKRKALEFHPDRNYNDTERATRLFTGVQAAYEVLSDPQERAWYDSHREQILQNDSSTGSGPQTNATTSKDVMEWFLLFELRLSYESSGPGSFYNVLGELFAKLANEEAEAAELANEDVIHYPGFGSAKSGYEDWAKDFYTVWGGFRTVKTFSWCDEYRYSYAQSRPEKRIMEKKNKQLRDAAIREFNDTVRSFVMFVRKRDPRFNHQKNEAQRQAALLAASKEQATRQRAENAAKLGNYKAADWTKVSEETLDNLYDSEQTSDEDGSNIGDAEEPEGEQIVHYECIVCKKTFGSEGPMRTHEQSKKHRNAVYSLKRQMQAENKEFDLDCDVRGLEKKPEEFTLIDDGSEDKGLIEEKELEIEKGLPRPLVAPQPPTPSAEDSENDNDDRVPIPQPNTHTHGSKPPTLPNPSPQDPNISNLSLNSSAELPPKTKLGKAKAKKAKKAKRAAAATSSTPGGSDVASMCATCKECFPSNTKMFNHLKDNPTHAKPVPNGGGVKKGKGKEKRK